MKKIITIILLLASYLYSLQINSSIVKNANTLYLTLDEKDIKEPKLTFDKHNINFYIHPKQKDKYYALVPISYYKKKKDYRIIISYIKNEKKNI